MAINVNEWKENERQLIGIVQILSKCDKKNEGINEMNVM